MRSGHSSFAEVSTRRASTQSNSSHSGGQKADCNGQLVPSKTTSFASSVVLSCSVQFVLVLLLTESQCPPRHLNCQNRQRQSGTLDTSWLRPVWIPTIPRRQFYAFLSNSPTHISSSGLSPEIAHFYVPGDGRDWKENRGHDWYVKGMEYVSSLVIV